MRAALQDDLARLDLWIERRALSRQWLADSRERPKLALPAAKRNDAGYIVSVSRRIHCPSSTQGSHPHSCYRKICKFGYTQTRMDESELLTVSQAAEACNATRQTIRNWIKSGRLHGVRIGNRFLIPRDEIERLRGDIPARGGESPWDYSSDEPAEPLPRKDRDRSTGRDPAEGLLGA